MRGSVVAEFSLVTAQNVPWCARSSASNKRASLPGTALGVQFLHPALLTKALVVARRKVLETFIIAQLYLRVGVKFKLLGQPRFVFDKKG